MLADVSCSNTEVTTSSEPNLYQNEETTTPGGAAIVVTDSKFKTTFIIIILYGVLTSLEYLSVGVHRRVKERPSMHTLAILSAV